MDSNNASFVMETIGGFNETGARSNLWNLQIQNTEEAEGCLYSAFNCELV